MQTVAIISQKGGAGKTTLAVNLAVTAEKKGKSVLLLDLDPQASSASWKDSRAAETPVVVAAPASRLSQYLETGRQNGADFAIIDTAPHSENAALESARAADLVLIPCRAGILDIRAIQSSLNICRLANKQAFVVLNALPAQGSMAEEAAAAIQQIGGQLIGSGIVQRIAFNHAMTSGQGVAEYEPTGKAAAEIETILNEVTKALRKSDDKESKAQSRRSRG